MKRNNLKITEKQLARFWAKVDKQNGDGCWDWKANQIRGYGQVNIGNKPWLAHRVSWMIHFGPIPDGMCVCHHCDNPSCVRPNHLFIGTQADNMRDMKQKGRIARGANHCRAKLTPEKVLAIRREYPTLNQYQLADKYNVDQAAIWRVINHRSWAHIDEEKNDG